MVNEAQLRVRTEHPINFTVANTIGIEKGALLALSDPMTASGAVSAGCMIAGIASSEKIASNGQTKLGLYRRCYADMVASGAITVGLAVQSASDANYPNTIMVAPVTASGACIIGHALETATDAEIIMVAVDIGCGGNHIS